MKKYAEGSGVKDKAILISMSEKDYNEWWKANNYFAIIKKSVPEKKEN